MRSEAMASKDHLRSRSRSNSYDSNDFMASPVRGMKRIHSSDEGILVRYPRRNRSPRTTTSVEELCSNDNELTSQLKAEHGNLGGTTIAIRNVRSCILIVAMMLVLFQGKMLRLRSTFNSVMKMQSNKQNIHVINDNRDFQNISVKELRVDSFVRHKQSDASFKPLLNVQCTRQDVNGINMDHAIFANNATVSNKQKHCTRIPTFIIAGAQKSGTSALYTMLSKIHRYSTRRVRRSNKFETHFFMHHANTLNNHELSKSDICSLRQLYQQEFISKNDTAITSVLYNDIVTFEKSPIYLSRPHLPTLIYQVVPWTKILLLLRNPIDRIFSQWKMEQARDFAYLARMKELGQNQTRNKKKNKHPKGFISFIDMIDDEVKKLRKYQLSRAPNLSTYIKTSAEQREKVKIFRIPKSVDERVHGLQKSYLDGANSETLRYKRFLMARPLSRGMYAQQVYFWLHPMNGGIGQYRINHGIKIIQYEKFVSNRTEVLQDTMKFLNMPLRKYPNGTKVIPQNDFFDADFRPGTYTIDERKSMWQSKASQQLVTSNETKPVRQYTTLDDMKDITTEDEILNMKMDDIVREYLHKFYQPYNDELVLHLGDKWKNIWS